MSATASTNRHAIDFTGRTVVVTGGARGMGEAVSRRFVAEGARVVIADLLVAEGEALAAELGEAARFVALDVTEEEDWTALRGVLEAEHGGEISAIVNSAGIVEWVSIEDSTVARFRRIVDINLTGTWLSMHALGPLIRRSGAGAIINFSSTQGIYAKPNMSGYAASKWGVRGLTKTAAFEFAPDGIRVCSIHPGPIDTVMTAKFDAENLDSMLIPRLGTVDEVADLVWFVASSATYSTGSEFIIDGGILLGPAPRID